MVDLHLIENAELRIAGEGEGRKIVGYAPKWNQLFSDN